MAGMTRLQYLITAGLPTIIDLRVIPFRVIVVGKSSRWKAIRLL